jgi:putative GTP pyrophosphokinase
VTGETAPTKSQLDALGSRLRNDAEPAADDLVLLNRYRERFLPVSDAIVSALRAITPFSVDSRHKSIPLIVAKLRRRQPARLSAIQDIAGARIIVANGINQDDLIARLSERYPQCRIDDKRARPTHGYRAVHVVVTKPLPFEVQIRTTIEHNWAQLSERLADRYGFELKYGGGPAEVWEALLAYSAFLYDVERVTDASVTGHLNDSSVDRLADWMNRLPNILKALRTE